MGAFDGVWTYDWPIKSRTGYPQSHSSPSKAIYVTNTWLQIPFIEKFRQSMITNLIPKYD